MMGGLLPQAGEWRELHLTTVQYLGSVISDRTTRRNPQRQFAPFVGKTRPPEVCIGELVPSRDHEGGSIRIDLDADRQLGRGEVDSAGQVSGD